MVGVAGGGGNYRINEIMYSLHGYYFKDVLILDAQKQWLGLT